MRNSIIIFGLWVLLGVHQSHAACRVCNANGVACISRNEFQFCFRNVRNTNQTFTCPKESQVCTKFGIICVDTEEAANVEPDCDETSMCGICKGVPDGAFSCTSRTTFTMCAEERLSQQRGVCPEGYLCDPTSTAAPCVICGVTDESSICDLDTPIDEPATGGNTTVSPVPPIVPTPTRIPPTKTPSGSCQSSGRFPKADPEDCSGYIHCYWTAGSLHATPFNCPEDRYFNRETTVCEETKPSWCT